MVKTIIMLEWRVIISNNSYSYTE